MVSVARVQLGWALQRWEQYRVAVRRARGEARAARHRNKGHLVKVLVAWATITVDIKTANASHRAAERHWVAHHRYRVWDHWRLRFRQDLDRHKIRAWHQADAMRKRARAALTEGWRQWREQAWAAHQQAISWRWVLRWAKSQDASRAWHRWRSLRLKSPKKKQKKRPYKYTDDAKRRADMCLLFVKWRWWCLEEHERKRVKKSQRSSHNRSQNDTSQLSRDWQEKHSFIDK